LSLVGLFFILPILGGIGGKPLQFLENPMGWL